MANKDVGIVIPRVGDPQVYAMNSSLGIFEVDDDDVFHYEKDPSAYSPPSPDYTAEIEAVVPPDGSVSIGDYEISCIQSYNLPPAPIPPFVYLGEYNSGEEVVNVAGYIPLSRRIEDLQRAGEALQAYRESVYDGHDIGDDDYLALNPFVSPNADLTDVDKAIRNSEKTMRSLQEVIHGKRKDVGSGEGETVDIDSDEGSREPSPSVKPDV